MVELIVFVIAGGACLVGAVGVVASKNPVHSALSLVGTLFGIGVLFIAQEANFTKYPFTFHLVDMPEPNAFALPGGKVGVHTGLFKVVNDRNELAAVMAHEVAHVTARHSAERMTREMAIGAGLMGIGAATSTAASAGSAASTAAAISRAESACNRGGNAARLAPDVERLAILALDDTDDRAVAA